MNKWAVDVLKIQYISFQNQTKVEQNMSRRLGLAILKLKQSPIKIYFNSPTEVKITPTEILQKRVKIIPR